MFRDRAPAQLLHALDDVLARKRTLRGDERLGGIDRLASDRANWQATLAADKLAVHLCPRTKAWMSDSESDQNLQIPLPGPEGPFVLTPKALFKAMKKAATSVSVRASPSW